MEELPMRPTSVKMVLGLAISTALASAGQARAADRLIPGQMHIVEPGALARMMAKPNGTPFPAPASDPTAEGGQLQIVDVGGGSPPMVVALPAAGWRRQGKNGNGKKQGAPTYRYQGAGTPNDPCTLVVVSSSEIKFVCTGAGVTL